jgi:hypothetical protein
MRSRTGCRSGTRQPEAFAARRPRFWSRSATGTLIEREGGLGRFAEGLFGSSEMFTWGLMSLYQAGVIRRRDDAGHVLQAALLPGP